MLYLACAGFLLVDGLIFWIMAKVFLDEPMDIAQTIIYVVVRGYHWTGGHWRDSLKALILHLLFIAIIYGEVVLLVRWFGN